MLETQKVSSSSKMPWLIFAAGCVFPFIAYVIDAPGIVNVIVFVALLIVGFAACVSAPWARDSDDTTTNTLLSFGAAAVYFCILAGLLFLSFATGGIPQG
jgi:hypothetical protein